MKSRISSCASFFTLGGMSPSTCQEEQGHPELARADCWCHSDQGGSHSFDYSLVFIANFPPVASAPWDPALP